MRERLLAGEQLNNTQIKTEYGIASDHCVKDVAERLRKDGHTVERTVEIERRPGAQPIRRVLWQVLLPTADEPNPSVSQRIKARLLAGETLTTRAVQDEYGVSNSLLGTVVKQMNAEGHRIRIDKEKQGRAVVGLYRLDDSPAEAPAGDEPPASVQLRQRFSAGESFSWQQVAAEFGVHSSYLRQFRQTMSDKGWRFQKTSKQVDGKWQTFYRLAGTAKPKRSRSKRPNWVDEAKRAAATSADRTADSAALVESAVHQPAVKKYVVGWSNDAGESFTTELELDAPELLPALGAQYRVTLLALAP